MTVTSFRCNFCHFVFCRSDGDRNGARIVSLDNKTRAACCEICAVAKNRPEILFQIYDNRRCVCYYKSEKGCKLILVFMKLGPLVLGLKCLIKETFSTRFEIVLLVNHLQLMDQIYLMKALLLQHVYLFLGFEPVVIENVLVKDELQTDVEEIKTQISKLGAENIVCVMTTTSCFAPRIPDRYYVSYLGFQDRDLKNENNHYFLAELPSAV